MNSPGPAAIELFAGVGGFRLGLERAGWRVSWSNQWEPGTTRVQHASRCYQAHFGPAATPDQHQAAAKGIHVEDDIKKVLDAVEAGWYRIPDHDLLTAGFPCQDYSVAGAAASDGIQGKKGVLWWQIHRLLTALRAADRQPQFLLLENVDRLLNSPRQARGRDFAIMLASLNDLGYDVEWRVVNAADYGFSQRRRRVFIVGSRTRTVENPLESLQTSGTLARSFAPEALTVQFKREPDFMIKGSLVEITTNFGTPVGSSLFLNSGICRNRSVWTRHLAPHYEGDRATLGSVLVSPDDVPKEFVIPEVQLGRWQALKDAKRSQRTHASGVQYLYVEGSIPFPDPIDRPARTITTTEGGASPSRFKHVVEFEPGRFRRLLPIELERLNGFPDGWTDVGLKDGRRAFLMGNALVVDVVARIAEVIRSDLTNMVRVENAVAS